MTRAPNAWKATLWVAWGVLVVLVVGGALGCGRQAPRQTLYELTTDLARARAVRERSEFVIGTAALEPTLGAGWKYGEVDRGRERSFRWGTRPRSELEFTVLAVRDLTLRLEGLPAPGPGAPRTVGVEINDVEGGAFELHPGLADYVVPISGELLRRGKNRLALVYGGEGDATLTDDRPPIAVSWYRIELEGLEQPSAAPYTDPRGRLFIPRGSQVDFFLRLPPRSLLAIAGRRTLGAPSTELAVHLAVDGEPERRLRLPGHDEAFELELNDARDQAVRLSLAAIAGAGGDQPDAADAAAPDSEDPPGILIDAPSVLAEGPLTAPDESPARAVARPNIIVYLVDTLRADRLGAYGYQRDVSPNIDRFAGGATLFENARAQSSWTLPAVASLFTGLWPPAHGVVGTDDKLSEGAVTLAEHLHSAGYSTSAIVANGFPSPTWGLDQGFEDHLKLGPAARESHDVLDEAISWLESRDRSRPFFLYLHTLDPHNAYLPRPEFRERFAADAEEVYQVIRANPKRTRWPATEAVLTQLFLLYDALIAQNDDAFGRTLDYLEKEGLFEDSLIVFLADHGEEFFEHGSWTHGANLFRETLDVPFIVKMPRQTEGRRVAEVAQQIDLLPTLLDYLEIESPADLAGRSLLGVLHDEEEGSPPRPVFGHTSKYGRETRSVIDGRWKLMERREPDRTLTWLIEWDRDPGERGELKAEHPIRAEVMRFLIESEIENRSGLASETAAPDEEERRDLRALGYIE